MRKRNACEFKCCTQHFSIFIDNLTFYDSEFLRGEFVAMTLLKRGLD